MTAIKIHDVYQMKVLVTREAARRLQPLLDEALSLDAQEGVFLDFSGVEGITPSFVDEILRVLEERLSGSHQTPIRLAFLNVPTRLSAKFAATGRGHGFGIVESQDGTWYVMKDRQTARPVKEP